MDITLSSDSKTYAMGWYGTCDNEEPFALSSIEDKLESVIQINTFGTNLEVYKTNKLSTQSYPFENLNRGYSYFLTFKKTSSSATQEEKTISIPGFVSAVHQGKDTSSWPPVENPPGEGYGRLNIDNFDDIGNCQDCGIFPTPTPTPNENIPLWISFSSTDIDTNNHFTLWHKLQIVNDGVYTKLIPDDVNVMKSDFLSFQGTNLLNIAMVQSESMPTEEFDATQIFGFGDIDLSCRECGVILPRLILVDDVDGKFIYTDRIYKEINDCSGSNQLSTNETSAWYKAPVVYNTINAPQKSVTIKELYFDMSDGTKLKLEQFKC